MNTIVPNFLTLIPANLKDTIVGRKITENIIEIQRKQGELEIQDAPADRIETNKWKYEGYKKMIMFLNKLFEFPNSSNLENFIMLREVFLTKESIIEIMNALTDLCKENLNLDNFNIEQIDPWRLLSLMVLSSRLAVKYSLRTNPEVILITQLTDLFQKGNGNKFDSENIKIKFLDFIKDNSAVNIRYFNNLVNGTRINEIYRANYTTTTKEISADFFADLIKSRLDTWLNWNTTIFETPIYYLFSGGNEDNMCKTIADFNFIGKIRKPTSILPSSVLDNYNGEVDFNKLNVFLDSIQPQEMQQHVFRQPEQPNKRKKKKK